MRSSFLLIVLFFVCACQSPYMIKHPVSAGDVYYLNATYYGGDFNGKKAADGSEFNENEMTCAARGFPFGTFLLVQSLETGNRAVVKVTDRPGKNVIDLSKKAFSVIDDLNKGRIRVKVKVVNENKKVEEGSGKQEKPVVVQKSSSVIFTIELGSFDDIEKAKEFQKTLDIDSYIFAQNGSVFKVRFGSFSSKKDAQKTINGKFNGKKVKIVEVDE